MPSNTPTPRISRAPTNTPIPRNQRQGQAVQGAQTQTSQITNEATPAATITAQVQKQEVNNTSFFGWITSFFRSAQAQ